MDILKYSQLVIFSHSTIFITFSYKSLAGFLFKFLRSSRQKTGSGVGFLRLTAVFQRGEAILLGDSLKINSTPGKVSTVLSTLVPVQRLYLFTSRMAVKQTKFC